MACLPIYPAQSTDSRRLFPSYICSYCKGNNTDSTWEIARAPGVNRKSRMSPGGFAGSDRRSGAAPTVAPKFFGAKRRGGSHRKQVAPARGRIAGISGDVAFHAFDDFH